MMRSSNLIAGSIKAMPDKNSVVDPVVVKGSWQLAHAVRKALCAGHEPLTTTGSGRLHPSLINMGFMQR
ncbi:hypothetical protein JYU12_01310 [bacterium AH-315-K03]|nr:hypothetical protein [bacterium AH-315-K03]